MSGPITLVDNLIASFGIPTFSAFTTDNNSVAVPSQKSQSIIAPLIAVANLGVFSTGMGGSTANVGLGAMSKKRLRWGLLGNY